MLNISKITFVYLNGCLQTHNRRNTDHHVTEMLKLCLEKICELQAELECTENVENNENLIVDVHDPEAAGYTACAMEALRFLTAQGLPSDHPMVQHLKERLLRNRD